MKRVKHWARWEGAFRTVASFPLLDQLNPAQREAVMAGEGHLCINAAAGTGKTSTIAARILHLQWERRVPPRSILAVSFSRSARANLMERLESFINLLGRGSAVNVLTLHGLAYRVLRTAIYHGETWLRPGFTVLTAARGRLNPLWEEYGPSLVKGLADPYPNESRVHIYARALDLVRQGHPTFDGPVWHREQLDDVRDEFITVEWDQGSRSCVQLGQLQTVWERYNRRLHQSNSIDYPGMLSECLEVLWNEGATLAEVQRGLRYLIVDEYQDTSRAQEMLVRLLAGDRVSVNVVGDSDQAIYTFNGSDPGNILEFGQRMAGGSMRLLPSVQLTWNYRSTANILAVANRVLQAAGGNARKLEPAPYGVSEAVEAYRRRNPPVVRVHARELEQAAQWVATEVQRLLNEEGVQPWEIAVLVRKDTDHSPQGDAVRRALAESGLEAQIQDRDPERTAQVLDILHGFLIEQFDEPLSEIMERVRSRQCDEHLEGITTEEALTVLEEASRAGATTAQEAADILFDKGAPDQSPPETTGVQVRTIHSAKGLEFRVVFLLYLGDGEFPSGTRPEIAEEQRLYYVGITRAMERLYVLGRRGVKFPSFFDQIDGEGVTTVEAVPPDKVGLGDEVDQEVLRQVEAARQKQKEQEARRQAYHRSDPSGRKGS